MDFRPDEEMLEAIRRNQKEMREPEGVSVEESVARTMKHCDGTIRGGHVAVPMLPELILVSHPEYGFWQRVGIQRKKSWEKIAHIRGCDECQKTLEGIMSHLTAYRRQS